MSVLQYGVGKEIITVPFAVIRPILSIAFLYNVHFYLAPNREMFSLPPTAVLSANGLINQGLLHHRRLETSAGPVSQGCRAELQEEEIRIETTPPQ